MPISREKRVLTTGEVAKICHVAPRTVSKWFDSGKLRGYRIPGSRDRRIPVKDLIDFMRLHGIPLSELDGGICRVLVVDLAPTDGLAEAMMGTGRFDVRTTHDGFEAGLLATRFHPHVVVLDTTADVAEATAICRSIHNASDVHATVIAAADGSDQTRQSLRGNGFDAVIAKPFTPAQLAGVIEQVTDLTF